MRVAIIADVYSPLRSSGAVQLRDLTREFARQGHDVTMLVASPELETPYSIEQEDGVTVVRLQCLRTKDMTYWRRAVGEFLMPFAMVRNFKRSPAALTRFDAVIWYSPTIFLGPIVRWLKRRDGCPSYLIIRDIFPQWAADMGLISRGPVLRILEMVAEYQYRSADFIGVQTPGNLSFFEGNSLAGDAVVEVLHNWLGDAAVERCSFDVASTCLGGRKIFVYAGNMGVAQQMDKLIDLAARLVNCPDLGLLFVGRGSEFDRIKADAAARQLDNCWFVDEIPPDQIPALYQQCHFGLISLDSRHRTHNIPGKFLTYLQAGIPVLASINPGNDLQSLVEAHGVGRVSTDPVGADLATLALDLLEDVRADQGYASRCRQLAETMFSARTAVQQLTDRLMANALD